jgi:hypothetical protein
MSPIDLVGAWKPFCARLNAGDALGRWAVAEPVLLAFQSPEDLKSTVHTPGNQLRADEVLGALVRLAAVDGGDEPDAVLLVLHLLSNGARTVARALRDLSPDIDALVVGELTLRIRSFPWQRRTRAYAANLLMDTRRSLLRELLPYRTRLGRDRVILVDPTGPEAEDGGLLGRVELSGPDNEEVTLLDVLRWAERTGVVGPADVVLLAELGQTGRGGIDKIAARLGVNEKTVRRRRDRALAALRTARSRYVPVAA